MNEIVASLASGMKRYSITLIKVYDYAGNIVSGQSDKNSALFRDRHTYTRNMGARISERRISGMELRSG